jgi:hypothetical protein
VLSMAAGADYTILAAMVVAFDDLRISKGYI